MRRRRKSSWNIVFAAGLIVIALLSATLLGSYYSSPKAYSGTLQVLDDQKEVATTLSIAVTAASTTLSTLPDDTASPIASELADLSMPLFVIVCILFMEKFLLTTFGWVSFTVLVPLACVLGSICLFSRRNTLLPYIKKILILALALVLIVPVSAKVTSNIQETFSESVSMAFGAVDSITGGKEVPEGEETNAIVAFFTGLKDNVVSLVEAAKNMLGIFTDAIAVLLITSCVIPILTALLFVWILKILFQADIPVRNVIRLEQPSRRELPDSEKRRAG